MLSVSNIAWHPEEEEAAAALLARCGVRHVDIAPGRYFPDPAAARGREIAAVRDWWGERGFTIAGMQALLFGTSGLNLFDDGEGRMLDRLKAVCRLAGALGVPALTFGSPRQRDRGGLSDAQAEEIAVAFFSGLGDAAAAAGVVFCLEPNAPAYGCNFMTNTAETARVVRAVGHPAIRLQLDIGNMALNGEEPGPVIAEVAPLVGHIHLSEPMLAPLGQGQHDQAASAIAAHLPGRVKTIEMVRAETGLAAVEAAVAFAARVYQAGADAA